ncbi:MAG: hypothetical protein ACREWG_06450 [Gammaproteobacteria bacterium]
MRSHRTIFAIALSVFSVGAGAGEFGNQCAMGLALGKNIETDCSTNWTGLDGKTYCFGNEEAKTEFLKDAEGNLKKATEFSGAGKS